MAKPFHCGCAITIKDIARVASQQLGWRVTTFSVSHARRRAAQEYCDAHSDDLEKGCIRNPFLARRAVGPSHVFTRAAAEKLLQEVKKRACRGRHYGSLKRERAKRLVAR